MNGDGKAHRFDRATFARCALRVVARVQIDREICVGQRLGACGMHDDLRFIATARFDPPDNSRTGGSIHGFLRVG